MMSEVIIHIAMAIIIEGIDITVTMVNSQRLIVGD